MLETILSYLFAPSLGTIPETREVRVWGVVEEEDAYSGCGVAQRKKYRDGIERVMTEGA